MTPESVSVTPGLFFVRNIRKHVIDFHLMIIFKPTIKMCIEHNT